MNIDDIQLMKNMASQIGDLNGSNKVLFLVRYEQIAKTNVILLKALLEGLKKNGIFVSIDRPHQYMEHLLRMHRVDYSDLVFLDTIATYSADQFQIGNIANNVKILDSPFQIHLLPDMFSLNSGAGAGMESRIDVSFVDFILIDNIATMLNYNDFNMVETFLENYLGSFRNMNNIIIPVILDNITHQSLYQVVKRLVDREVIIDNKRLQNGGSDAERKERSLLSEKKSFMDLYSYRKCLTGGD